MKNLFFIILLIFFDSASIKAQPFFTNFETHPFGTDYSLATWNSDELKTADWENGMNKRSMVDTTLSFSGKKSLRVENPKNRSGPGENGAQVPIIIPARDQYYLSYFPRFSENFSFRLGGKLPGLASGDICCGGETCHIWFDDIIISENKKEFEIPFNLQ